MKGSAPLRFLAVVVGGWIGFRLVILVPDWVREASEPEAPQASAPISEIAVEEAAPLTAKAPLIANPAPLAVLASSPNWIRSHAAPGLLRQPVGRPLGVAELITAAVHGTGDATIRPGPPPLFPRTELASAIPNPTATRSPHQSRWSGSAWLLLRGGGNGGLAPGGTLGGSQAGARFAYRVNDDPHRPLTLNARLYSPLERPRGAEIALGIDWRPFATLPVHVLAERRQRIGREGRSDFALSLYGGAERRLLAGRLRVDAYGQAGVVGIEERDLFADGQARAGIVAGRLEIGAGIWGGAQPGAARLDAGPQASARLSVLGANVRASAEWRFRVAGDASPGSGPALTIGTDF
jgi:hypothetical protein